jgi:hypothetical protein
MPTASTHLASYGEKYTQVSLFILVVPETG